MANCYLIDSNRIRSAEQQQNIKKQFQISKYVPVFCGPGGFGAVCVSARAQESERGVQMKMRIY